MKTTYKIKSRTSGPVYIALSDHAMQRMEERQIDLLDVLISLTEQVENLVLTERKGDTLLINPKKNLSILLSISETQKDIKYLNIITLLNDIFDVPARTPEIDKAFNDIRRAISHKELESAESQINNIAKKVSSSNTELLKVRLMLAQAKLTRNKVS